MSDSKAARFRRKQDVIIQNINDLIRRYHRLGSGDVVNTRVISARRPV